MKYNLLFEVAGREVEAVIDACVAYSSDGIGRYECGSQKCFDKGETVAEVEGFSLEEATWTDNGRKINCDNKTFYKLVSDAVDNQIDKIEEQALEEAADCAEEEAFERRLDREEAEIFFDELDLN